MLGERPVALLGGGATAVPIARSLAGAGIPVHALGNPTDPLANSRWPATWTAQGTGPGLIERRLEWLAAAPAGSVVLPCDDGGLELVAKHRATLEDLGLLAIEADDDVLLAMLDKRRTYALADEHGIAAPRTVVAETVDQLLAAAAEIGYPCALKPIVSHEFASRFKRKAFVAASPDELTEAFAATEAAGVAMLVTEIVSGPDSGFCSYYSYIDENGEPLFELTKRKPRQFPIGFGAGCYHVMDWDPEVAAHGLEFFRAVGVRGLANVEFKRDAAGELKLIECNHRFTGGSELLRAAGADLALFTYNRLVGRPLPSMWPYKKGLVLWYPLEDVRALGDYRRKGELTVWQWLRSLLHPIRFPVASLADPRPSLVELRRRLGGWIGRRLPRRSAGG